MVECCAWIFLVIETDVVFARDVVLSVGGQIFDSCGAVALALDVSFSFGRGRCVRALAASSRLRLASSFVTSTSINNTSFQNQRKMPSAISPNPRAGSAQPDELDRLLDYDDAVEDFLNDVPIRGNDTATAEQPPRDEDQEVQVKKKRAPVPKLDENRYETPGARFRPHN